MSTKKSSGESSWVKVQEKAFTAWMDETVKKRNMEVNDLHTDLEDGLILINFFEILCGRPLPEKYDKKPAQKIQKINNLHLALRFLERDMGAKNPGCSAEDIVDAEKRGIKLILGLLWTLYRKYRMKVDLGDGKERKKGTREEDMLLEWVRSVLEAHGYSSEGVTSFKTSFNDGDVYWKLAKIYDGDKNTVNFEEMKSKPPAELLESVFDYAEGHMGVNKLLDAEEVAEGDMDERALALYTSLFYHAFKSKAEMEQMQATLGQSEFELELQQKGKEELIKMNYELNELVAKLRAELEQSHQELVEARERIAELEKALAERDAEKNALKSELAQLEDSKSAEILKRQAAEEQVKSLQEQVEAAQLLCESEQEKRQKLEEELAKTKEELEKLKERLEIEMAAKAGGERELTDKLSQETEKNRELTEKHKLEVEKNEQLESEVNELRRRVKRNEKEAEAKDKMIEEAQEVAKVNTSGLAVLRANLDTHLSDLNRWRKYLDGRASTVEDPVEEVARLNEELEKLSFQEQLNLLSNHLQEENVAMSKILREREAENAGSTSTAQTPKKKTSASSSSKDKKKKKH